MTTRKKAAAGRPGPVDAVVAGYLGIDLTPRFRAGEARSFANLFQPGRLIETDGLDLSLGGAVANTGMALQRFGQRVAAMACVGDDWLGNMAATVLRSAGLDVRGVGRKRRGTAYGIVLAPPGTDRLFLEDPGCNRVFSAADVNFAAVRRARLFHLGYPPLLEKIWANQGAELRRILRRVHDLGVVTSLDLSLPDPASPAGRADWKAILARVLPLVDIFVPSLEELLFMLRPRWYAAAARKASGGDLISVVPRAWVEAVADEAIALGARVVMIKCGHHGACLRTRDLGRLGTLAKAGLQPTAWNHRSFWARAKPVDAKRFVNACGAGDSAVAAFLAAFLSGENIEHAADLAMQAGRDSLYGVDATAGLADWAAMTARSRAR